MRSIDHLALCATKDISAKLLKRLVRYAPQQLASLNASSCQALGLANGTFADRFAQLDWEKIEHWRRWQSADPLRHHLLTWFDPNYPVLLKTLSDPPVLLFAKGDLKLLKNKMMAVVGSRKPTIDGKDNAAFFSFWLAHHGWTIVSGLARGIDATAHQATLNAGGQTIAVLGCGIQYPYPKQNQALKKQIEQTGLVITEYGLDGPPVHYQFPKRNRIIAALCQGIIVAEASLSSGSLITAKLGLELGREIFAIPGAIRHPQSRGGHLLIKQGAKLADSLGDIHEELSVDKRPTPPSMPTPGVLEPKAHLILESLSGEPKSVERLVSLLRLTPQHIHHHLTELTLVGLVERVPGGYRRAAL